MATLYEDSYCHLTKNSITLKMYYFPIGDKTIPMGDIRELEVLPRFPGIFTCKTWGMALSSVWWACGKKWGLAAPAKIMIITTDSIIRKGFVCANEPAFMAVYNPPLIGEAVNPLSGSGGAKAKDN